ANVRVCPRQLTAQRDSLRSGPAQTSTGSGCLSCDGGRMAHCATTPSLALAHTAQAGGRLVMVLVVLQKAVQVRRTDQRNLVESGEGPVIRKSGALIADQSPTAVAARPGSGRRRHRLSASAQDRAR